MLPFLLKGRDDYNIIVLQLVKLECKFLELGSFAIEYRDGKKGDRDRGHGKVLFKGLFLPTSGVRVSLCLWPFGSRGRFKLNYRNNENFRGVKLFIFMCNLAHGAKLSGS